jgi:hypothetical protein
LRQLNGQLSRDKANLENMRRERLNGLPWSRRQRARIERMGDHWQERAGELAEELGRFQNELVAVHDEEAEGGRKERLLSEARQVWDLSQQVRRFADALQKYPVTQSSLQDEVREWTERAERTARALRAAIAGTGEVRRRLDVEYLTGAAPLVKRSVEDVRRLTRHMIARRWVESAPAMERLKAEHRVRMLRTSDGREMRADSDSPRKPMTDLRTPLQRVLNEYSHDVISGVILLSDGGHNSGDRLDDVLNGLRGRSIPVHTVTIGSDRPARDLAIVDYQVPVLARKARPVSVIVRLKNTLPEGTPFQLRLRRGERVLREISLRTEPDADRPIVMRFTPENPGLHRLLLEVRSEGVEDAYPGNDSAVVPLRVAEQRLRCLTVAETPSWDLRYMLRALKDMPATPRVVYTAGDGPPARGSGDEEVPEEPDQWGANDLIVLAGRPFDGFDAEDARELREAVEKRGAGILVLAGESGGYMEKLADAFGWGPVSGPAEGELSLDGGSLHLPPLEIDPVVTEAVSGWRRMAAPEDLTAVPPQHATLLADTGGRPVLSYGLYGNGRVLCLGAGGLYRMREYEGRKHARRLLENILVTAAGGPFRTDDGRLAVLPGVPVAGRETLVFVRKEGLQFPVALKLDPGSGEPVRLPTLGPELAGGLLAWPDARELTISCEGLPPVKVHSRQPLTPENVYFAPDEERLQRIADATDGRHTGFARLAQAGSGIEPDRQVEVEVEQYSLWQHWWFFLGLAGLAVTEYVLRRRAGMVL